MCFCTKFEDGVEEALRKYFKKLLSYSVYRKTLITYSISILVITTVILTSLYGVFIVSIKQNQMDSTKQLLGQLVREVDNLKTDVDNVMSVIANDSKTLKFVQNRQDDKKDNYYLFLKLQEIKSAYSYIENISVINFNNTKCIEAVGNNGGGEDNIEFAALAVQQNRYIDVRVVKLIQKNKNVVSFLEYMPYYNAAVIEDVNADWFQYSISDSRQAPRSVYIIDVDGSPVTNNTRELLDNIPLSDYFYSIISGQDTDEKKTFTYDDKKKRQLIFFSESPEFGWWFIDVQDYSNFNSRFQKISIIFIGMELVLVTFCLLLSVIFNKKIRKPLIQLVKQSKNMAGLEEEFETDEIKYLDMALARGTHEKYLKENYIKTLYLYNLLTGEEMPLFIPQKDLTYLKDNYRGNYYCVLLLKVKEVAKIQDCNALEMSARQEEYKLYRYTVCNLSDEIFGEDFRCSAVDMGEDQVGILFFLEKKAMPDEYILCFKQLKEFAEKMFPITINGSLGIVVEERKDIYVSYHKAKQYLEMNQLIGREELIDANNQVSVNYQEKNRKLVESILEYTEYNFNNPELSLKSISQTFGLSTTYLGKIFRAVQGEAYSSYVTNYRLEKSKHALLLTAKTVNEIASEAGFTNSTYFATLFKNTYGMTPTAFRNKQSNS